MKHEKQPRNITASFVLGINDLQSWNGMLSSSVIWEKRGTFPRESREIKHVHLEQLHPAFLFGLDALLHLRVGLYANALEGGHVLLAVLRFGLGVGQLDYPQARVPQAARQSHKLRQREGHHGGLRPACRDAGLICFLL